MGRGNIVECITGNEGCRRNKGKWCRVSQAVIIAVQGVAYIVQGVAYIVQGGAEAVPSLVVTFAGSFESLSV